MFYLDLELNTKANIEIVRNNLDEFTTDLEILGVYNKGEKLYES
jgi:prephenate dehydratase